MNRSMILYIIGSLLEIEAALLLLPALIGFGYHEKSALIFLCVATVTGAAGLLIVSKKPKDSSFFAREGFVATALCWLIMSAIGALPFRISGQIPHYVDALFEMVSGFTTTGASILTDVEALDKCMLFWRSFSHWVGGMGVLVFMMAILPLTGAGGQKLYLMRAESPGPSVEKLSPKIQTTATWLYGIYLGLTVLCILFLMFGGMDWFSSVCLAFGAAGTGGFSVLNSSFASYNLYCKTVCTIFMLLFGINFNFYYLMIIRRMRDALHIEEIRWYIGIYFFASLTILLNLHHAGMLGTQAQPIDAFFSVSSIMTTTGYGTADFNLWPTYSKMILVIIMFSGACAGSTGGGLKVSRLIICVKSVSKELRRLVQPRTVRHIRMDGKKVEHATAMNTLAYLVAFVVIYIASILVVSIDGFDTTTAFTAVAATINNIGPGLNIVGPTGNYAQFSYLSKFVLIFDMLAGRLEIWPLLFLMSPVTWKRRQ